VGGKRYLFECSSFTIKSIKSGDMSHIHPTMYLNKIFANIFFIKNSYMDYSFY